MVTILTIISIFYGVLIVTFCLAYDNIEPFTPKKTPAHTAFSIVIPFRNEAENLPQLMRSLLQLDYPTDLFEIIFIDDSSEDSSATIVNHYLSSNISLIKNIRISNSPKKDAITLGVKHAKNAWIITTDADCVVPKYWLTTYNAFIKSRVPQLIAAPITYSVSSTFLDNFQLLDVLSLQTATVSGFAIKQPFLCNGANLAYTKELFEIVSGYHGNDNISSGDDIFLLEKALAHNKTSVQYLKAPTATVITKPESSTKLLLEQRVRWAAKTSSYKNTFGKLVGFIVVLMNAILVIGLTFYLVDLLLLKYLVIVFGLKFVIDLWCISKSAIFFNQKKALTWFPIASFVYPFFSVFIAVHSLFSGYTWKHRSYRK